MSRRVYWWEGLGIQILELGLCENDTLSNRPILHVMFTLIFIILKLTNTIFLGWWCVVFTGMFDLLLRYYVSEAIESAYLKGIEDAYEEKTAGEIKFR